MGGPWENYQQAAPQGGAPPPSGPWERYAQNTEPEAMLDYDKPIEQLRGDIAQLPEANKTKALKIWADKRVAKERAAGFDQHPDVARGIPVIGGLLDEATAGIQAGLNSVSGGRVGAPYNEALAYERAREHQAEEANPAEAVVGQTAAGLTTGGPILGRMAPARTLLGRVGQGAAVAVPLGITERFTRGEGSAGERAAGAIEGAPVDAVVGAALPVGASAVTRGVGAAREYLGNTATRLLHGPEQAADDILVNRMYREGSSPAAKRLDLQRGQAVDSRLASNSNAMLPETIADTSDAMRRLTGSLYRQGGEAGDYVRDTLSARQRGPANAFAERPAGGPPEGQQARIMDATERALLIRSSDSARRTERQIMADQSREGARLYDRAYQNSDDFDLQPVIDAHQLTMQQYKGPFRAALQRAQDLFVDPMNRQWAVNNVRRFDASKKQLDDMIEGSMEQGRATNLTRELRNFKEALLNRVHGVDDQGNPTINQAYQNARDAWGSAAENREAIDLGRSALRDGSEVSVEHYRDLSRGQQQLFRLGFLESMRNALGTKMPGSDVTQLFQQQRVRDLMGEIIPRSQGRGDVFRNRPERFGGLLNREQRMVQTNNEVLGNSKTAQRQQDDTAFAGDALANMWDRFRHSPSLFNMGLEAVGVGIQKMFGYRQDVAAALARRLLEQDPTARNQILRRLSQRGGPDRFARFADHVDRAGNTLIGAVQPQLTDEGGAR